eukprot:1288749-Pyramimonas_sp.AAC.1
MAPKESRDPPGSSGGGPTLVTTNSITPDLPPIATRAITTTSRVARPPMPLGGPGGLVDPRRSETTGPQVLGEA